MNHKIDRDTYIIPPNFIESGTFFGGMFKARNVIEAGILAFAIGVPVFSLLPLGLTARIIALCLTALQKIQASKAHPQPVRACHNQRYQDKLVPVTQSFSLPL